MQCSASDLALQASHVLLLRFCMLKATYVCCRIRVLVMLGVTPSWSRSRLRVHEPELYVCSAPFRLVRLQVQCMSFRWLKLIVVVCLTFQVKRGGHPLGGLYYYYYYYYYCLARPCNTCVLQRITKTALNSAYYVLHFALCVYYACIGSYHATGVCSAQARARPEGSKDNA